jgi:hypothetical protein
MDDKPSLQKQVLLDNNLNIQLFQASSASGWAVMDKTWENIQKKVQEV